MKFKKTAKRDNLVTPLGLHESYPQVSEVRAFPLTGLEQKMLECVTAEPKLSRATIASRLSVGQDTAKEYLGRLKKKGMLIREKLRSLRTGG